MSLSEGVQVSIRNSGAHVRKSNAGSSVSLNLLLDDSFIKFNDRDEGVADYGSVRINAINDSRIDLIKVRVNQLYINLKNSAFEEKDLFADSIQVIADKTSAVKLGGDNIIKAKFLAHE